MKCPSCDNENLIHYTEEHISVKSKINKNKTIAKRNKSRWDESYSVPDYIECLSCPSKFDYELNENGRIISLQER